MSEEILINVSAAETRVALVENGSLLELHIERHDPGGIRGNVYRGQVARVLPGMQAAFVDVGLERNGFLHAADLVARTPEADAIPPIGELVRVGQELLVQVTRNAMGTKGARLSTQLSLPSRYLVLLPFGHHVGVSMRIEDEVERERLRERVTALAGGDATRGYIVRTNAEGVADDALAIDLKYLHQLWESLQREHGNAPAGTLVYEEPPLLLRAVRDLTGPGVSRVLIDSKKQLEGAREFMARFGLEGAERLEYYPGADPIFDLYGVEDDIQRALERKVPLQSGGHIIIEQTEAMTTIDVNTGAYVGHGDQEQTLFRTNLEAAQTIARQLRLRNLGGLCIIDFIDMSGEDHKSQVLEALQAGLGKDPARTRIGQISDFGLVELTRKRGSESLEQALCEPCPVCRGRATVKSAQTVCAEIFREMQRAARQAGTAPLLILAAPEVVERMLDQEAVNVKQVQDAIGRSVRFQAEAHYPRERFDVVAV